MPSKTFVSRFREAVLRLHHFLLPEEPYIGWVPYLWLVYLSMFLVPVLFDGRKGPLERGLSWLAIAVFLALYFRGYRARGREALAIIAGLVLLGVGFSPFNSGAAVFVIYGAAYSANVGSTRTAFRVLGAVVAVPIVQTAFFGRSLSYGLAAGGIGTIVGLVNIFYSEVGRKNAALRLSQEEVKRLATMAERGRIARDLHDLLGHTLSVIALKSELASKLLPRDPARAADEIRDVERISREALSQVRAAVTGYRSGGLAAQIADAKVALQAAAVTFTVEADTGVPLPPEKDAVLGLVLREAVTNVIRHANATSCRVAVRGTGDALWMEIADDGRGGEIKESSGLSGMRERLNELGGTLRIETGRGTRLLVELPA